MTALRLRLVADLRARWRSWLAFSLLLGLGWAASRVRPAGVLRSE